MYMDNWQIPKYLFSFLVVRPSLKLSMSLVLAFSSSGVREARRAKPGGAIECYVDFH